MQKCHSRGTTASQPDCNLKKRFEILQFLCINNGSNHHVDKRWLSSALLPVFGIITFYSVQWSSFLSSSLHLHFFLPSFYLHFYCVSVYTTPLSFLVPRTPLPVSAYFSWLYFPLLLSPSSLRLHHAVSDLCAHIWVSAFLFSVSHFVSPTVSCCFPVSCLLHLVSSLYIWTRAPTREWYTVLSTSVHVTVRLFISLSAGVHVFWLHGGHRLLRGRTRLQEVCSLWAPRWHQTVRGWLSTRCWLKLTSSQPLKSNRVLEPIFHLIM